MKRVGVLMGICLLLAFALGLSAQQNAGDDEAIRKLYGDFFETFRQADPRGLPDICAPAEPLTKRSCASLSGKRRQDYSSIH